jgi:hypothetical protein
MALVEMANISANGRHYGRKAKFMTSSTAHLLTYLCASDGGDLWRFDVSDNAV